jgi:hypothetical protein
VGHLGEVIAFELATIDATVTDRPQEVEFTTEPLSLLTALGEGRLPDTVDPGEYVVEVTPPTKAA